MGAFCKQRQIRHDGRFTLFPVETQNLPANFKIHVIIRICAGYFLFIRDSYDNLRAKISLPRHIESNILFNFPSRKQRRQVGITDSGGICRVARA